MWKASTIESIAAASTGHPLCCPKSLGDGTPFSGHLNGENDDDDEDEDEDDEQCHL
jgi:hypothetical protein